LPGPVITLDQWRAFVAVVDTGSFAKAAEHVHRTQSTITYAVQQIERLLGIAAFRTEGRRSVLTPTGELLYRRARYLLDDAVAIEQASRRVSAGWEAELAVAVEIIFPTGQLLAGLQQLGEESPHTRIEVIETVLGARTDLLASRIADVAIFSSVPPGFLGEPLMRLRFVLVTSPEHPLQQLKRKVTLRDLRQHRQLVVRESSPSRMAPTLVDVTQRWTVSHMPTSIEAVRMGYGFAWLPEDRMRDELASGTLKPVPMRTGGERFADLYLILADAEHSGPAARRLVEILRERVAGACPVNQGIVPAPRTARRRKGLTAQKR
jgi:DNA-binding transcriptional LysR family regulator